MNYYVAGHALIERSGKYLLTRRSQYNDYMPLKWDIPGGEVLQGETLQDAITREVLEETTLSLGIDRVIYIYSNIDQVPVRQSFQATYLCRYISGEVHLNPSEHDKYEWLILSDILKMDVMEFLREAVQFIA